METITNSITYLHAGVDRNVLPRLVRSAHSIYYTEYRYLESFLSANIPRVDFYPSPSPWSAAVCLSVLLHIRRKKRPSSDDGIDRGVSRR